MSFGPSRVLVVIPHVPGSPEPAALLCDAITAQLKDSQFPAYPVDHMQTAAVRDQVMNRVRKKPSWIMVTTQEGGHKLELDGLELDHVVFYGWPKREQLDPQREILVLFRRVEDSFNEFLVLLRRLNTIQDRYKSFTIMHYYLEEIRVKFMGNCIVQARRLLEMLPLLHERAFTRQ